MTPFKKIILFFFIIIFFFLSLTLINNFQKEHLIVLVIAGGQKFQYEFYTRWWKEIHVKDVKIYLTKFGPKTLFTSNTLIFEGQDSIVPGIMNETLLALKYIEAKHRYKYVLLTNLSSFFDFYKLLAYLRINSNILYGGCNSHWWHQFPGHQKMWFACGGGIILNREGVHRILNADIDWRLVNDVAIRYIFKDVENPHYWEMCWLEDPQNSLDNCPKGTFHWRVKTGDEKRDLQLWNQLMTNVY
jgi:hypothetical protein